MKVLLVFAHPEPRSLNGALRDVAVRELEAQGHEVRVSDLYADGWKSEVDRDDFPALAPEARLKVAGASAEAFAADALTEDVRAEQEKLLWADMLILQFPLWWLGMPAILKGWVDRVFAVGRAYGNGRYFGRGVFTGKRAMCAITIGGPADAYGPDRAYGPLSTILHPIHHGILGFTGFAVADPFVVHAPARLSDAERAAMLAAFAHRVCRLDTASVTPALSLEGFSGLVRTPIARIA